MFRDWCTVLVYRLSLYSPSLQLTEAPSIVVSLSFLFKACFKCNRSSSYEHCVLRAAVVCIVGNIHVIIW